MLCHSGLMQMMGGPYMGGGLGGVGRYAHPMMPAAARRRMYPPGPQPMGFRPCCQNCIKGDVLCLANCDRMCRPGAECNAAGAGAYAAFCQEACRYMGGLNRQMYLPLKACEGECAAQTQELCKRSMCREYGCEVADCARHAPQRCVFNSA